MKELISSVKDELLSTFETKLEELWLEQHKKEIESQRNKEFEREETKWAQKESQKARSSKQTRTLRGYTIPDSFCPINHITIQRNIEKKYREDFLKNHWKKTISALFSKKIDTLPLNDIFNQLTQRHPWIYTEFGNSTSGYYSYYKDTLAYKFLIKLCNENLEHVIRPVYQRAINIAQWEKWSWSTVEKLISSEAHWEDLSKELIEQEIEGFPLLDIRKYFYFYYPNLPSTNDKLNHSRIYPYRASILSHSLTRLDVYRYLFTVARSLCDSKQIDGVSTTGTAPFVLSELKELTPNRLNHLKTLVVNITSEENPFWICLHKSDPKNPSSWTAYIPEFMNEATKQKIRDLIPQTMNVAFATVDYTFNSQQNDIDLLDDAAQWQAVLFGRIYPYCVQRVHTDLDTFRKTTPLSILLEYTLIQCQNSPKYTEVLKSAFARRAPFSNRSMTDYINEPDASHQLLFDEDRYPEIESYSERLLPVLDNQTIKLEDSQGNNLPDDIILASDASTDNLIQALIIQYHNDNLTRLTLPMLTRDKDQQVDSFVIELFDKNSRLMTVTPDRFVPGKGYWPYSMNSAARNRFLHATLDEQSSNRLHTLPMRQKLWQTAGAELFNFYSNQGTQIDLDYVDSYLDKNREWRNLFWDQTCNPKKGADKQVWTYAQIAQIGTKGIDALFNHINLAFVENWNSIYKEPAPNLSCVFDLTGDINSTPAQYAQHLKQKISEYDPQETQCSPLFQSLAFIIPDTLKEIHHDLFDIFNIIHQQKKKNPDAVSEITLYNLNQDEHEQCMSFLMALEKEANNKNNPLQILVRIPGWDRDSSTIERHRILKEKYKHVQNLILENQRQSRLASLNTNTHSIYDFANGVLDPEVIIDEHQSLKNQQWDGNDIYFPLSAQTPGIQQQLQQAVEQEYEQEQEEEQEEEQEQEQEINEYIGDESRLITRHTIDKDELSQKLWNEIPDSTKKLSGWTQKNLKQLFSLWVGSEVDAAQVISKIEPSAIQKIMEQAPSFRFGSIRENLPAGFFLSFSRKDKGLVLCYNERREKTDLYDHSQKSIKKRNPFTVQFHQAMKPEVFRGDFRQFTPYSQLTQQKKLLAHHLTTEDTDEQRLDNALKALINLGVPTEQHHASIQMQEYTAFNTTEAEPGAFVDCLDCLKKWASNSLGESGFLDSLFNSNSPLRLTPGNIKAFGQLFYTHDVVKLPNGMNNGSQHFLFLAKQIFDQFGSEDFAIWKRRIVDPSANLTECLSKEEVNAVALSLATLKNKPLVYQNVWWQLVEAHGKATGHMRYAPLWQSYQKLLNYLEKNHLVLDEPSMINYLKTSGNFHGQVFLDRLYRVLRTSEKEVQKQELQQQVLNHIDQIDWHHNGFYYATHYDGFPLWNEHLHFTEFKDASNTRAPGYHPGLDDFNKFKVAQLVTQCLRFVSKTLRPMSHDFSNFLELVNQEFIGHQNESRHLTLRLLSACLVNGVDRIQEISNPAVIDQIQSLDTLDPELLAWLNSGIKLDLNRKPGTLRLKFEHAAPLLQAIQHAGLKDNIVTMPIEETMPFINACGRALQCYSSKQANTLWPDHDNLAPEHLLQSLLSYLESNQLSFNNSLLTHYPWLFLDIKNSEQKWDDPDKQTLGFRTHNTPNIDTLYQQVQSIDFDNSTHLPANDDLTKVIAEILNADRSSGKAIRDRFIEEQINKGCAITHQDAAYRPLNQEEKEYANLFIAKHLKANFKSQNLLLCEQLFDQCMAVSVSNGMQKKQLEAFLSTLAKIDNKPFYNDFAQVIGLLLEQAKSPNGQQRYYSLDQLTAWLTCLVDPINGETQHYPTNILHEIISSELEQTSKASKSTLINSNLDKLDEDGSQTIQSDISKIVQSNIPAQYKPVLARIALRSGDSQFINQTRELLQKLHQEHASPERIQTIISIVTQIGDDKSSLLYHNRDSVLNQLSYNPSGTNFFGEGIDAQEQETLNSLWDQTQVIIGKLLQAKSNDKSNLKQILGEIFLFYGETNASARLIRMILLKTMSDKDAKTSRSLDKIDDLKFKLSYYSNSELKKLALYCNTLPIPTATQLSQLLSNPLIKNTDELIDYFETIDQASTPDGISKRHYSISEQEKVDLMRVLNGFKRKGKGSVSDAEQKELLNLLYYTNNFSQVADLAHISFEQLTKQIDQVREELTSMEGFGPLADQSRAKLLACMREVLLRKTGKWANHTQMLDLIYASKNNESLLHQVRTGQGKSIITIMRASYLALNGYVVDVFSSKDSLSRRDHEEFAHVLDAFRIRNAYITPHSSADAYQTNDSKETIGAVNYATIGNFSLYQSTQIWQQSKNINLDPKMRVAWIDECDHILKDEDTQFNYSASGDSEYVYNFDEWVYRLTYDFYLDNKDHFIEDESGTKLISRNKNLKALCEFLQKESTNSPKQSQFLKKFIVPALDNEEHKTVRDNKLKQLLFAAHTAYGLKEGVHFCIRPDEQSVGHGTVIKTRFAKVIISNQIKHGSTYSDLVHQLLHVRLNKEAIEKGQTPNFFIEPDSQIAISSNAKYILNKYYDKLEGCTGTVGNIDDMKSYESNFGIEHVVKLPTHEELRTNFLGIEYCANQAEQIEHIVDCILKHQDRPILMTCEDDIQVKKIALLVREGLRKKVHDFEFNNIIVDTNDSGKSENQVVPIAGKQGKITISSRMGRGTDIKPKTEEGLLVLRTYPTIPRVTKQERGRQGRNGAKGTTIDIIDYGAELKKLSSYLESEHKSRLEAIIAQQKNQLVRKFKKHNNIHSKKWKWLEEDIKAQEKYVISRSVQQLKHELKKRNELFLRRKESLIAVLSGNVMDVMRENFTNDLYQYNKLQEHWLDCRKDIEADWNIRLAGEKKDSEEVFTKFIDKASRRWHKLCAQHVELNVHLIQSPSQHNHVYSTSMKESTSISSSHHQQKVGDHHQKKPEFEAVVSFFQHWINGAEEACFGESRTKGEVIATLYRGMSEFYLQLYEVSAKTDDTTNQTKLFNALSALQEPQRYLIPLIDLKEIIKLLSKDYSHDDFELHLKSLNQFLELDFIKKWTPKNAAPEDLEKLGILFKLMVTIATNKYLSEEHHPEQNTKTLIANLSTIIYKEFWNDFDQELADNIAFLFTYSQETTAVLTHNILGPDLHELIHLIQYNQQSNDSKDTLNDVGAYLTEYHDELKGELLSIIRPMAQIALSNPRFIRSYNYLPEPRCLVGIADKNQHLFWYFLAQRRPIKKEEVDELAQLITTNIQNDQDEKDILQQFADMPPYLSIHYVIDHLKKSSSKTSNTEFKKRLQEISDAALAFNTFALRFNLIATDSNYSPDNKVKNENAQYEMFLDKFSTTKPGRMKQFFALCTENQYRQTATSFIFLLADAWTQNKIKDTNQLSKLLELGVSIDKLPKQWRSEIRKDFDKLLSSIDNEKKPLDKSLTLFQPLTTLVSKAASVSEQLDDFKIKYPKLDLKKDFDQKLKDAETLQHFSAFLQRTSTLDFQEETMVALAQSWFSIQAPLKNEDDLKRAVKTITEARQLQTNKNWADYFLNVGCPKRENRQTIMHGLVQGIINLGDAFANRCYKEYANLANDVIRVPDLSQKMTLAERRHLVITNVRKVAYFADEIKSIAINAPNSNQQEKKAIEDFATNTSLFFKKQEKTYDSAWWKNKTRKNQANTLFYKLIHANKSETKIDYIKNSLDIIWQTQKEILESDKGTNRNTKGYSRLYDITVQMTIHLARDLLAEEAIEMQDKVFLNEEFQKQIKYHIDLLKDRLPEKHPLKEFLIQAQYSPQKMPEGSVELSKFKEQLTGLSPEDIPKNLRYLHTNIVSFIDIAKQPLSQGYNPKEFGA